MRVCPNCGYVDPPWWRIGARARIEYEVTHINDLEVNEPEFAERLKKEIEIVDEFNAYRLYESGWVRRRWRPLWEAQKWEVIPREKVDTFTGIARGSQRSRVQIRAPPRLRLRSATLSNKRELARMVVGR